MLERMQEKPPHVYCWWECKIAQALWKIVLQFLIKLNTYLRPRITFLGIYPRKKKKWNLCLHKNLNTKVPNSFIFNNLKLETSQVSFKGWMLKPALVHPYNKMRLSIKRNQLMIHITTWMYFKSIVLSEKTVLSQKLTFCLSLYR